MSGRTLAGLDRSYIILRGLRASAITERSRGAQLLTIEHIDSAFGAPRRFHFWRSAVSSRPGFFFADECLEAGLRTINLDGPA